MASAVPLSGETCSCDWSDLFVSTFWQPIDSAVWKTHRSDEVCVAVSGPTVYFAVDSVSVPLHSGKGQVWRHWIHFSTDSTFQICHHRC